MPDFTAASAGPRQGVADDLAVRPRATGGREIVLTGFRAFPGVPDNPSERLIRHLQDRPALLPALADCALLDVDYRRVEQDLTALLARSPAALLLTGYSASAGCITLESRATALCAPDRPDVAGHVPQTIAAPAIDSPLALDSLAADLRETGLPVEISADAGQYVCNFSYRHVLSAIARAGLETHALFVHVPAIAGTPAAAASAGAMPLEDMARAVARIASWLRERSPLR